MLIENIKINDLNPAKYNPRIELKKEDDAYKRIQASIKEFGFIDPIVINKNTMTVIGGHQRLKILKDMDYETVECVVLNLDEKAEKRLNLALNKNSGYWDNTKLEELFDELKLSDSELFATGFSNEEIENLKADFINDLLEDDYSTQGKELDKFAITFNIAKEHEEKFSNYIKKNGKDFLIDLLVNEVERML